METEHSEVIDNFINRCYELMEERKKMNIDEDEIEFDYDYDETKCEKDSYFSIIITDEGESESFSELLNKNSEPFKFKYLETNKNQIIRDSVKTDKQYQKIKEYSDYIEFHGKLEEIYEFINKNLDYFKDKTIKIEMFEDEKFDEKLANIVKKIKTLIPSIKYNIKGNEMPVDANDLIKTIEYIKTLAESIEGYALSPLERTMVLYDIVRENVYTKEDENEDYHSSRDLTSVVTGDKIVCVGYAHILQALLDYYNIPNTIIIIKNENGIGGHARNIVKIKDKKYGVDGLYFFDATFDSKKSYETTEYRNRIKHFAQTFEESRECFDYKAYPFLYSDDVSLMGETPTSTFYDLGRMATNKTVRYATASMNERKKTMHEIYKQANTFISKETMIELLYNVRRFEQFLYGDSACFSYDDIFGAYLNKYGLCPESREEKLLRAIFGTKGPVDILDEYQANDQFNIDKKRIELVKMLKEIRKMKEEQEKKTSKKIK